MTKPIISTLGTDAFNRRQPMTSRPATPIAQTPQTDEHIWKPPYRYDRYDDCFRDAENWGIPIPVLMELFTNALAESDRLKALCEELRVALNGTLNLIDNGWLVRNTTEDGTSGWALRQVEPIKRLQEARAALEKVEKPQT